MPGPRYSTANAIVLGVTRLLPFAPVLYALVWAPEMEKHTRVTCHKRKWENTAKRWSIWRLHGAHDCKFPSSEQRCEDQNRLTKVC
eukprot:830923-Rhodomonas_salina.5